MERRLAKYVERRTGSAQARFRFEQVAQALCEYCTMADHTDQRNRREVGQVRGYLKCQLTAGGGDLVGIHDLALRTPPVRFVAVLLGLLDALEGRQRAFLDPASNVPVEVAIETVIAMRPRISDEFDLQLALAEAAYQRQRRDVVGAAEPKAGRQVCAFVPADTSRVRAAR